MLRKSRQCHTLPRYQFLKKIQQNTSPETRTMTKVSETISNLILMSIILLVMNSTFKIEEKL